VGLDPAWIELFPYQATATPGQTIDYELRVRNHRSERVAVAACAVLPPGWRTEPGTIKLAVEAGQTGSAKFRVSVPKGWHPTQPRLAIAADVKVNGRYLGQIAEAVIDVHQQT
jgi:hypothetical protein